MNHPPRACLWSTSLAVVRRFPEVRVLALLGLGATSASASPGFVQSNNATPQSPQAVVSVEFSEAQAAGDLNVVVVGWNDSEASVQAVSDLRGNPYHLAAGPFVVNGVETQAIYYSANIVASPAGYNTVTVTFGSSARYADVRIAEYSGVDPSNPLDAVSQASGASTLSTSGSLVTSAADDLLIAANLVQTATKSAGGGYTNRVITSPDGDILEDQIATNIGTYRATAPLYSGGTWIIQLVAFHAASSVESPPPPDTTPPTVAITTPTNGATVSGRVTVSANASDNVAVAKVQMQVDGANTGAALTSAPYQYTLDTTVLSNGTHTLTAVATDTSNNAGRSAPIAVTVNNEAGGGTGTGGTTSDNVPPTVSLTSPAPGASLLGVTLSGAQIAFSASASDNVAIASVQFQVDGYAVGSAITAAPYSYRWDSTSVPNGPHTVTAVARDTSGNRTTSAGTTVVVSNSNPVVGARGPLIAAGPSQPASNYFTVGGSRAAYLVAGSHTWNSLQDEDTGSGTTLLDFNAYVAFLQSHGMNATILWRKDLPKFCYWGAGGVWTVNSATGMPWARTGPGNASDGLPKFDLTKLNQGFFDRLLARATQLQQNGLYAIVQLFDGYGLTANRCGTSSPTGDGYPFTAVNNINGINDGYSSGSSGTGSMTMGAANAITAIQDAYVRKVIDTLGSLQNVLWEISQEAPDNSTWWQGHIIDLIRSYEATKGLQHPIGYPTLNVSGASDSTLLNSNADWIAPQARLSPTGNCGAGTPPCKIDINDSDHTYFGMWSDSAQINRNYLWENLTNGAHVLFMDPYVIFWPSGGRNLCDNNTQPPHGVCSQPDPRWNNFRDNLGYALVYANTKLDLAKMSAQPARASTGHCLVDNVATGAEFLVYAPSGGGFTVDLSAQAGAKLRVEWLNPANGAVMSGGTVAGGSSSQSFTPPWGGANDAVLYLVDTAGRN